ncbi:hypothetical protein ACWDSJ_26145 [Nocardia sp. NPDC003482]
MSDTPPPWQNEPAWRARLMQRIQDLAVRRATLRRAYLASGGHRSEATETNGREEISAIEALIDDLEQRALASGISRHWLEEVGELGDRGIGYLDHYADPARGTNRQREVLIDLLAEDVWHLQHMAVLSATRRDRLYGHGVLTEPEPGAAQQFQRIMITTWLRADSLAASLDLTPVERKGLWATTIEQWRDVIAAASYSDDELARRWWGYARITDVQAQAGTRTGLSAISPITGNVWHHTLPTPTDMISAVEHALVPPRLPPAPDPFAPTPPEPQTWEPLDPPPPMPHPPPGADPGTEP